MAKRRPKPIGTTITRTVQTSASSELDGLRMTVHHISNRQRIAEGAALVHLFAKLPDDTPTEDIYGRLRYASMATHTDFAPEGVFPLPTEDTAEAWRAAYARFLETDGTIYERWAELDAVVNPERYTAETAIG